ncbi:hypothetical protein ACQRIU_000147 [Beauveria bassiana]
MTDGDLEEYIQSLDKTWDPKKTIRISRIPNYEFGDILQMVIPRALLNSRGGKLDIKVDFENAKGPTVDYGQWEETAKGMTLPRLTNEDKMTGLSKMVDTVSEAMDSATTIEQVARLVLRANNAMYTAREAAGNHFAEAIPGYQGKDNVLAQARKDESKWYIKDRENYGKLLAKAAAKCRQIVGQSFEDKVDLSIRAKAVEDFREWANGLVQESESQKKSWKVMHKGGPTATGVVSAESRAIEKEATKKELKLVDKALKEVAKTLKEVAKAQKKVDKAQKNMEKGDKGTSTEKEEKNDVAAEVSDEPTQDTLLKKLCDMKACDDEVPSGDVDEAGAAGSPGTEPTENPDPDPDVLCRRAGEDCIHIPKGDAYADADEGELVALARQRSKESFNTLLRQFDYNVVQHDELYGELSARLPEFTALSPTERITQISANVGEGALAVAGLFLYGKAIADVFSRDSTVLDKAAVITSILPGIGCAFQLADDVQKQHIQAGKLAMCFIESGLIVAGFWEIAVVMQIGEELANWIKAENTREEFWDMDVLAKKGAEGWLHNAQRLISHISSEEFIANATTQFAAYQVLTLYQASQLVGDLHASHNMLLADSRISDTLRKQGDIHAHIQPELKRQICATMAESKYRLRLQLESVALNHTAKLEAEFRNKFLDDWLQSATTVSPVFGVKLPDWASNTALIHERIEEARATPFPLYEDRVKKAVQEVIERLDTPAPCQCLQSQKKAAKCEFAACSSPHPQRGDTDAAGRVYVTNMPSIQAGVSAHLTEECVSLFTPCPKAGPTGEPAGRQLWCKHGDEQGVAAAMMEEKGHDALFMTQFLDKHLPTCVDYGMSRQDCEYVVDSCYYPDDTSDAFVANCIQSAMREPDMASDQARLDRKQLCAKFAGHGKCIDALIQCATSYPDARAVVLFACAAKLAPRADTVPLVELVH